jgi:hypothetical protein
MDHGVSGNGQCGGVRTKHEGVACRIGHVIHELGDDGGKARGMEKETLFVVGSGDDQSIGVNRLYE